MQEERKFERISIVSSSYFKFFQQDMKDKDASESNSPVWSCLRQFQEGILLHRVGVD
jgi:hypothetical protein